MNRTIRLRDGRNLSYAEYGSPQGRPVFYFHGGNSSRLEAKWFQDAALKRDIRLVAPDRPGFGRSDPQPGRRFLDWPLDVAELADALNFERFGLIGLSGGGPHAGVVARQLPDRSAAAAVVSGTAPPEMPHRLKGMFFVLRLNFYMARYLPFMNRFFLRQMSAVYADADKFLAMIKSGLPEADRALAENRPELIYQFTEAVRESHRQGIEADFAEWQLYVRPWGFSFSEIKVPVYLWYGQDDILVPVEMGRYLHACTPGSLLRVVPDGGHFSTINNHIDAIFSDLSGHL